MENPDCARHTRSFVTALVIAIALVVGLPAPITRAQDPNDAAKQAFADWKAALQKRDDAKQKVADAQAALATARAASLLDKKLTDAEKATLKNLENAVAEAQAALQAAEDELFKAAEALEKALLDLPEDSEVRKDIKRQRDAILHPTTKVISSIAPNAGVQVAQTKSYGGVSLASFGTAYGTVKVTLPDDIAPGDTISGTVIAEPSGKTDAERRSNAGELSGYVVEIKTSRPASNECRAEDLYAFVGPEQNPALHCHSSKCPNSPGG
jgi:surface antigen